MHDGHNHDHSHGHDHRRGRRANRGRLAWTLVLAGGYMVAEVVGGLVSNSLALLADAGHMLSDVAALGLSLFALWIAERRPTPQRTFGYYRAEILAALANGAALVAVSLLIVLEAWHRFRDPPEVTGSVMMGVAIGGLAVNLAGLWLLHGGRQESLNVHGAWLHVLSDTLGSIGAIAAGLVIWLWGWRLADPIISVGVALLIVYSAWRLLAASAAVLMQYAPRGIDVDEVHAAIKETPGVLAVHDLHVWTIASGLDSLSAHVVTDHAEEHVGLLKRLRTVLHERFGIDHITIQIEPEDFPERRGCL